MLTPISVALRQPAASSADTGAIDERRRLDRETDADEEERRE